MSRMSAPTPIYNTKRAEDLSNLNRILMNLSIDERARILTTGQTSILKPLNVYTASVTVNIAMKYSPYVMAAFTDDNLNFYMLPYIVATGASSAFPVSALVKVGAIKNEGGVTSITFTIDTTNAASKTYYIYYLVFKDKIVPTTSIIGN